MKISDQLLCLFSGQVEERDDSYVIEVPKRELRLGDVDEGQSYRVAVLSSSTDSNEGPNRNPKRRRNVTQWRRRTSDRPKHTARWNRPSKRAKPGRWRSRTSAIRRRHHARRARIRRHRFRDGQRGTGADRNHAGTGKRRVRRRGGTTGLLRVALECVGRRSVNRVPRNAFGGAGSDPFDRVRSAPVMPPSRPPVPAKRLYAGVE